MNAPSTDARRQIDRQAVRRTSRNVAPAALMLADDRCRPTHAELARRLKKSRSAVTRLLTRFAATLSPEERARWEAVQRRPKCRRAMVQGLVA